MKSPLS